MNLTDMRTRVRQDLKDTDPANYRWTDDEVEGAIERVVREFSLSRPDEQQTTIATTPDSREIDISTLTDLLKVFSVEFPVDQVPPVYESFETWNGKLYLTQIEGNGENTNVRWGKLYHLDSPWVKSTAYSLGNYVWPTTFNGYRYQCTTAGTSGSSEPTWPTTLGNTVSDGTAVWTCAAAVARIPEEFLELIVLGSTGYLAVSATIGATGKVTTGGRYTVANFHSWGQRRLERYEAKLKLVTTGSKKLSIAYLID